MALLGVTMVLMISVLLGVKWYEFPIYYKKDYRDGLLNVWWEK